MTPSPPAPREGISSGDPALYYERNLDRVAGELIKMDATNSALNHKVKQKASAVEVLSRLHEIDYPSLDEGMFLNSSGDRKFHPKDGN
jgi:hypothetical protein